MAVRKKIQVIINCVVFLFFLLVAYIELDIPIFSDFQSVIVNIKVGSFESVDFKVKWIILGLVILLGVFHFMRVYYENEVSMITEEKNALNERLKSDTKDLYDKFFELIDHKDRNNIRYSMEEYIQLEPFVMGVQLYTYRLKHRIAFNTVRPKHIMELKINHLESVIAEQEDLNAVVQSYDKINYWLYKDLENATKINSRESYERFLEKYTKRLYKQMNNRQSDRTSIDDVMIFNAIIIATERLFEILNQHQGLELSLTKIRLAEIDTEKLYAYKRTGLLRLILNGEFSYDSNTKEYYLFRNRKYTSENNISNTKENRLYLGRTFEYNKKKHLILFTLNSEILGEENGTEKMLEIEEKLKLILNEKNIQLG